MTESNPAFDASAWLAKDREYASQAAAVRARNKTALFDVLAQHGIATVTVTFDGCGDSGQIENLEVEGDREGVELPPDAIELQRASCGIADLAVDRLSAHDAIEALVFDLLEETHAGWENNDGAYGTFRFDTAERTITLEYSERRTETDYFEHEF
jgi:hypothetical protein